MLTYLPWKKNHAQEPSPATTPPQARPVLSRTNEEFLTKTLEEDASVVVFGGGGDVPVLPSVGAGGGSGNGGGGREEERAEWKQGVRRRWEGIRRSASTAVDKRRAAKARLSKEKGKWKEVVPREEVAGEKKESEEDELRSALDGLNLAAENGRAFSLSPATARLLDRFAQILKDLVNGVPTAYNDLVELLESSSKTLEETFASLPSFLQKLIKTLPDRMGTDFTPEILQAAAAASPGIEAEVGALHSKLPALKDLVGRSGLLGMLKSVVSVLKTRFPVALGGANLALSLALFVVLFVLWYCHKRGREERLERERLEAEANALSRAEAGAHSEGGEGSSSSLRGPTEGDRKA